MIRKLVLCKVFVGVLVFSLLPYEATSSGIYEGEYISAFDCGNWKIDKEFSVRKDDKFSNHWLNLYQDRSISFSEGPTELLRSIDSLAAWLETNEIRYAEAYGYTIISYQYGSIRIYEITNFTSVLSLMNFSEKEFEEFAGECVDLDRIVWRLYVDEVKEKDDK